MTQTPTQRLLTAVDVAERLGVPRSWVYAQARQNTIPFVRLGHYRRFRPEAIDSWIREIESHQPMEPVGSRFGQLAGRRPAR